MNKRIVYFKAVWCAGCKVRGPIVEQVSKDTGVPLEVLDIDEPEHKAHALSLGLKSIPAAAIYDGDTVVWKGPGGLIIADTLKAHLA